MELESGIEKEQVLKGKGKEREGKERARERQGRDKAKQGKGKAGKCQRIERRKELNWKEKKRREVVLARIVFPFFSFPSPFHTRELRVNI